MTGYPKRGVRRTVKRRTPAPPRVEHGASATIGDAPITITLSQLDAMRADVRAANERSAQLERDLVAAKTADPSLKVHSLARLVREGCLPIIRFALANLPPSEIPKWPADAVRRLADHLTTMPDANEDDRVLVVELEAFADDVDEHDRDRAERRRSPLAKALDCT